MYLLRTAAFLVLSATLVLSTPTPVPQPIDQKIAGIIAQNENIACTGPQGCSGANGTAESSLVQQTSGAASLAASGYNVLAAAAALAGSLSGIAALV